MGNASLGDGDSSQSDSQANSPLQKWTVISSFPEMLNSFSQQGVFSQALKKGLLQMEVINPRDFTHDVHRKIDDRPFGGGDGMIMMAQPLDLALKSIPTHEQHVVYLSPQGSLFSDQKAQQLAGKKNVVLICGRYGGVDQRLLQKYVNEEISIGDYVLSGAEPAAMVVMDAVARFLPGVLGHPDSAFHDSITQGYLEAPNYTQPRDWDGQSVPIALLSGNHALIAKWRKYVGWWVTEKKRPDLFSKLTRTAEEVKEYHSFVQEHLQGKESQYLPDWKKP